MAWNLCVVPFPTGHGAANREGAVHMKAIMGHVGEPPASMLLHELVALKARVAELERALATAERLAVELHDDRTAAAEKQAALA